MSQQTVAIVIDKLLSDEDLRIRFLADRIETLADLYLAGVELRPDEIALFYRTDARLWFWGAAVMDEQHGGELTYCDLLRSLLSFFSVGASTMHSYDACVERRYES